MSISHACYWQYARGDLQRELHLALYTKVNWIPIHSQMLMILHFQYEKEHSQHNYNGVLGVSWTYRNVTNHD